MKKTIATLGLAGILLASSCANNDSNQDFSETVKEPSTPKEEYFKLFEKHDLGVMDIGGRNYQKNISTQVGDFDGDKDLDMITINKAGKIVYWKNISPQKNYDPSQD